MISKKINYVFIAFLMFQFSFCKAQNNSICHNIYPFVTDQISTNDTIISITNDKIRLNNAEKFYSLFYIANRIILDSLSFDSYSNSGAKPKDLFFWTLSNGKKLVCLEYNIGSGIGHINIDVTKLFLFDLSKNKLDLIDTFGTDSAYYDSWKNYYFTITSRIFQNHDTLYIARRGWKSIVIKNRDTKINNYNMLTKIIWHDGKLEKLNTNRPPYFYYKGW